MINTIDKLPSGWKWVKLGEISKKIDYGFTASADFSIIKPRLLRITDIQNGLVNWETVPGCKISDSEENDSRLLDGDIVIARTGATTGKSFIIKNPPRAVFASYLIRIQSGSQIFPEYLYYFCQSNIYWQQIDANVRGAAQGGVNATLLSSLSLPLPPLPEQKRIAAILEKCDRLRRTRRYSLQLSETFLQSVFLEMFGDPVTNPMGWDVTEIANVCMKITDGTHQPPLFTETGIPFIFVQNIVKGEINFSNTKFVSESTYQELTKNTKIELGDILYSSVGSFGVAVQVLTKQKFIFQRHIAHLKLNYKKINSSFLCVQMNSDFVYSQAKIAARGVAQPTVNLGDIREFKIILPPLPLQEKFTQIVQKHERIRTQQREAERQAEHLFQTLLHRAFRGELTSSDSNEVDISALSAETHPPQPKPKPTDKAENLPIPATQPQTNALQLTLPGLE